MLLLLKALPIPLYYLCGAFPSGHLIAKYHGVDIAKEGSGNVGATNIARTMGRNSGIATLLLDVAKGAFAVSLAWYISNGSESACSFAGLICIAGHCFSIPPYLKGGKGAATSLGVLSAIHLALGASVLIAFALTFTIFRIVSLASVVAAGTASVAALLICTEPESWYFVSGMTLVVIYRHKENLERLAQGKEKKFNIKKNAATAGAQATSSIDSGAK